MKLAEDGKMNIIPTEIADVLIVEPRIFGDERGFFFESFNQKRWNQLTGLQTIFVQDNHSRSTAVFINEGMITDK